jgi:hypothetical protein
MGLGSLNAVPLAAARELAGKAGLQRGHGIDPILCRRAERPVPTFGEEAEKLMSAMAQQWRNAKHRAQWDSTLRSYAAALWPMPVDRIRTEDVLRVLQPI